jgi:hypothetical protein
VSRLPLDVPVRRGATRDRTFRLAVGTAVAAVACGALVAGLGLLGIAAVLGLLLLALASRLNSKTLAVVGLVAVLLSRTVDVMVEWTPAEYLDEVVTVYLAAIIVGRRLIAGLPLRRPPGLIMFTLFAVAGAVSSVVNDVPLSIAAAGGILAVKGVVLYFVLSQIGWTRADIGWLGKTAAWALGIVLATALVNLVIPNQWSALFSNTGAPQYRSFLPSLVGPFTHPLQFGNFMALAGVACWAVILLGMRARGARAFLVASAIGAVLSFRRTAIVGMLASLSFLSLKRKHVGVIVMGLVAVPLLIIALAPVIREVALTTYLDFVAGSEDNARSRMTLDSIALAVQHFPFGVGFGRFGSSVAADNYSIEYSKLDYDHVYGLAGPDNPNNHGRYLTDTQWPAIVGETGLIGALCFAAGLWLVYRMFRRASQDAKRAIGVLGLTGMGWSVHIALQSFAYPVYVLTPTAPMLFGLAAITYAILSSERADAPPLLLQPVPAGRSGG